MTRKAGPRPVPDDFATHGKAEGDLRLRKRYGTNHTTIVRWRAESGIYCGGPKGIRPKAKPVVVKAPRAPGRKPSPNASPWFVDDDWNDMWIGSNGVY